VGRRGERAKGTSISLGTIPRGSTGVVGAVEFSRQREDGARLRGKKLIRKRESECLGALLGRLL